MPKALVVAGMGRLLSVQEAAEMSALRPVTIRAWAAARKIASYKLGRRRLIPESEIMRVLECGFVPARPERSR